MEFRGLVKDVVRSACRTALLDAGFTPDDYFYENMDTSAGGTTTTTTTAITTTSLTSGGSRKKYLEGLAPHHLRG